MKCPHCTDTVLIMSDRQGIEIDYCPSCRGIWLDRGELDKLLERAAAATVTAYVPPTQPARTHTHRDFEDSDYQSGRGHYPRRKKSWLSEILD